MGRGGDPVVGLAFVFPGQGSQAVGMGIDLASRWPAVARRYEEAAAILGYDLLGLCREGPEEKLAETGVAQPALFVAGYATNEVLRGEGLEPALVAGHSLGEYTACAAAGVFSFADGLKAVKARAEAMSRAASRHPGGMIAVMGAGPGEIDGWVAEAGKAGPVLAANRNAPDQVIVSGAPSALDLVGKLAGEAGKRVVRLKVSGAFHSPLMAEAAETMKGVLAATSLVDPDCPVVGNVDGRALRTSAEVRRELEVQLVSAVRWDLCVKTLLEAGVNRAVECGPGRVLAGLIRRNARSLKTLTSGSEKDLAEAISNVKEVV